MSTAITEPEVDLVCLGLGQMSGPVAAEVSRAGYSVVGIEKGRFWDYATDWAQPEVHDEWQMAIEAKFDHPLYISTFTLRNYSNQMALPKRRYTKSSAGVLGHAVGGAATHYAGNMGRAGEWTYQAYSNLISRYGMDAVTEDMLPANHDLEDWPMPYSGYVPYYNAWEQCLGISGLNQDPFSPNSTFPVPAHPTTPLGALFQSTTESMGYHPFPQINALVSEAYVNQYGISRNGCLYCGYCTGTTCRNQCEVGAKSSSHVSSIPAAVASGNFTMQLQSYVFRINTNSDGTQVTGVSYYDQQGQVHIQPAKVVFGGIWGVNTVRLQLLSGVGTQYNPTTATGTVGRAPTGYGAASSSASGTFAIGANGYSNGNGDGGGYQIEDFKNDNFDHTGLNFISGGILTAGNYIGNGPGLINQVNTAKQTLTPAFHASMKDVKLPTKQTVSLSGSGMNTPTQDTYWDLDPHFHDIYGDPCGRITYYTSPNKLRAATYIAPFAANILTKMGATNVSTTLVPEPAGPQTDWGHHLRRGNPVGLNSATSSFNVWQQSWVVPNYFAAGEMSDTVGDETGSGTHLAGPQAYLAAEGIKQYLASPGLLTSTPTGSGL